LVPGRSRFRHESADYRRLSRRSHFDRRENRRNTRWESPRAHKPTRPGAEKCSVPGLPETGGGPRIPGNASRAPKPSKCSRNWRNRMLHASQKGKILVPFCTLKNGHRISVALARARNSYFVAVSPYHPSRHALSPETGLMRTLTSASRVVGSSKIARGAWLQWDRPKPLPERRAGWERSWSLRICHPCALPVPSTVQPGGVCPIVQVSKLTTFPAGDSRLERVQPRQRLHEQSP